VQDSLPCRVGGNLLLRLIDHLPIDFSPSSININFVQCQPSSSFPEIANNPEEDDDWKGKHSFEPILGRAQLSIVAQRVKCGVELNTVSMRSPGAGNAWETYLSCKHENDENQSAP